MICPLVFDAIDTCCVCPTKQPYTLDQEIGVGVFGGCVEMEFDVGLSIFVPVILNVMGLLEYK